MRVILGLLRLLALGLFVVLALAAINPAGAFSPGVPVPRDAQQVERTIASVRYLTANDDLQVRVFYAAELRKQGIVREYGKDWINLGFRAASAPILAGVSKDIPGFFKTDAYGTPLGKIPRGRHSDNSDVRVQKRACGPDDAF
jgi:hypothetical protein